MLARLAPFVFLAALAAWEAAGSLLGPHGAPTDAEWAAVEAFVRAEHRPGDVVTFAPAWISQIGRARLGDLVPVALAARPDADRYARVLVVRLGAARAPEQLGRKLEKERRGRLSAGLYVAPPADVRYDFVERFAAAEVAGGRAEITLGEVDYAPHRCILVQPTGTVSITFPVVPIGRTLVGYTGLDHFQQRKLGKGVVELAVYVGDQLKERLVHGNGDGWRRFEIDTSAATGQERPVRFEIRAPDPRHRRFCFHVEARS